MDLRPLTYILIIVVLGGVAEGQSLTSPCQDLDTTACVLLQKQKADLCNEPAFANLACKRFCGLCPLTCFNCTVPVLDKHNCITTTACPANQTCMLKHLRANDGHHEYIMQCERKDICDGLGLGFPIGKRGVKPNEEVGESVADEEEAAEREQRDVSLSCCDTDFCNFPYDTTTTSTTTVPTSGCHRDIVFVVDDSGSVGHQNFDHGLDFIREIINAINIGPNGALVSLVQYSSHPKIDWFLSNYTTKAAAIQATNRVTYQAGGTQTGQALAAVRMKVLQTTNGDRPSADNVVVVMTDGRSNNKADTISEAHRLHMISSNVIAVVIGNAAAVSEHHVIATDAQHVFDVRHYTALTGILANIVDLICTG